MKRLIVLCILLTIGFSFKLTALNKYAKFDLGVAHYLKLQNSEIAKSKAVSKADGVDEKVRVVLSCADRNMTEIALSKMCVSYTVISKSVLTAQVNASQIIKIAEWDCVKKITGMNQHFLKNDAMRFLTKVDQLHSALDLETPFTGKGVVIGCVDMGMLYTHPAFWVTSDSTRILEALNLSKNARYTTPSALKNANNDGLDESHATHVMGIAAGGKQAVNTEYYGMAPDANIVAVSSSNFSDADILEGAAEIKKVAEERGMPYVINLSLGANYGTHDGNSDIDHQMDEMSEEGAIFCVSAGNEREDKLHAYFDFKEGKDSCLIVVKNYESTYVCVDIVCDDDRKIEVIPCIFNANTNKVRVLNEKEIERNIEVEGEINAYNGKYYSRSVCYVKELLGIQSKMYYTIFRVKGNPGQHIDAFLQSDSDARYSTMGGSVCASYDGSMSIGNLGDCHSAITVGAYVSKTSWKDITNKEMQVSRSVMLGEIAPFSSVGPITDSTLQKPNVCAPGMVLCSAIDKSCSSFVNNTTQVCQRKRFLGKDYYYGVMQGTSMSTPCVSGIVALWLEANPYLTYKHVHKIIEETSDTDLKTGIKVPNVTWGYGKINAYAGLKKALEMLTDVQALKNVENPLTIHKDNDTWRLLLNSQESFLNISIITIDGKTIYRRMLRNLHQGEEHIVPFSGLSRGFYIIKTQTSKSNESRKIIIK